MKKLRYKNRRTLILLRTLNTHLEVRTSQIRFYSIVPGSKIVQGIDFPQVSYIDVRENWELFDLGTKEILPKYLSVIFFSETVKTWKVEKGKIKRHTTEITTFWKNIDPDLLPRKDNLQNQPTSQSTPPESKSSSHEKTKENNHSKNCGPLWKRFKEFEGKYIKLFYSGGYGIQFLKVSKVDYDSEDNEFRISGFGPYLRRGIIHNGWDWTNYVCEKERVLPEDLLQAQEISEEGFKKAEEMLREKLSHEKTVRNFLEKDKKPLTDLVGKYLKYTQDWTTFGTTYFHLKDIQIETYGDYQCCEVQYEGDRFAINKKGGIIYLTGKNIEDSISFESFKDAVIITEEEFNKARSREGFKKQEKPIKIYTEEELKSSILKYTSPDGSIYYLEHPEIPNIGIENKPGKFRDCIVSYGITISNSGQVHFYTPKTNPFNPIVLLIESDEEFFSRVEEISDYEWGSLNQLYRDKIVKI